VSMIRRCGLVDRDTLRYSHPLASTALSGEVMTMSETHKCPGCPTLSHPRGRTPFCHREALRRTIPGGVLGVLGNFRNIAGARAHVCAHTHSQDSFSNWMGHPGHPSQTAARSPESAKVPSFPRGGTPQDTQDTTPEVIR